MMSSEDPTDNIRLLVDEDAEEFAILDGIFNSEEINEEVKTNVAALKQKFNTLKTFCASHLEISREEVEAHAQQIDSLKGIQDDLQADISSVRKYVREILVTIEMIQLKGSMSNESLWEGFEAMKRVHSSLKQELTAKLTMLEDYHVYTENLKARNAYLENKYASVLEQLRKVTEEKLETESQVDSLKAFALAQDERISKLFLRYSKREEELFQEVCRNSSSMSLAQSQDQPSEPTSTVDLATGDSIEPNALAATDTEPPVVPRRMEPQSSNESLALTVDGSEKHKFSLNTQIYQLKVQLRTAKETLKIETRRHIRALKSIEEERQKLYYQNEEIRSKLKDAEEILDQSLTNESIMRTITDEMNQTVKEYKTSMIKCADDLAFAQSVFDLMPSRIAVDGPLFYDMITDIRMILIEIANDKRLPLAVDPALDIHEDLENIQQRELELAEVKDQMSQLDSKYDDVSKELKTIKSNRKSLKDCTNCVNLSKRINDLESQARVEAGDSLEFYKTHCDYQTQRINELRKEMERRTSDAQVDLSQDMIDLQNDNADLRTKYNRMKTIARMRWTEIQELKSRLGFDPAQGPSTS